MSLNDLSVNLKAILETKQAHNYFNQLAKKNNRRKGLAIYVDFITISKLHLLQQLPYQFYADQCLPIHLQGSWRR